MKGEHQLKRSTSHAKKRDRKRQTKMKISGKSVFTLAKIKDKH